jgi:hypothetical protein
VQLFAYSAVSAVEAKVRREGDGVKEFWELTRDASGSEIEQRFRKGFYKPDLGLGF